MRNFNAIIFTILVALFLALLPMPAWAAWARPAWVLMVLIFWTMVTPDYVNVGIAWTVGLLMDILMGTMLGEHALALTIVIYFVCRFRMRINMYPMLQQGLSVFFFVLMYQFVIYSIQGFVGDAPSSHLYWLSAVTSVVLWPWLFAMMRDYCRWARIYRPQ